MAKRRYCFVPNCNSGYKSCKEKVPLFLTPADPNLFTKWSNIIPRQDKRLSKRDVVCAKHFFENDIIKEWKSGEISIPYKRQRLSTTAVPALFPNCPKYVSKKKVIPRRKIRKNHEITDSTSTILSSIQNTNMIITDPNPTINNKNAIFNHINENRINLHLPSGWGTHYLEQGVEKQILFSKCSINYEGQVYFVRQILLNMELDLKFLIYEKIIPDNILQKMFNLEECVIKSLADIEMIINKFNIHDICHGGPSSNLFPGKENKTCVGNILKSGLWRHNKCSLILNNGEINCKYCCQLINTFRKKLSRPNMPSHFERLKKLQNFKNNQLKKVNKLQIKNRKLSMLVHNIRHKFNEANKNGIIKQLDAMNLPPAQKLMIEECIKICKVKSKNGRRYTHDWLLHCLLIYIRSPACYKLLLNNNIMPVCSVSTIRKYLRNIKIKCGIDENFLLAFRKKMENKGTMQRHGILLFDEVQVRTSLAVNCETMKVEGVVDLGNSEIQSENSNKREKVDHALVFMFSGIAENYSQPVAVYGVKGAMKGIVLAKLIIQIIIALSKGGAIVHGIICDGATTNRRMWQEFGISGEMNSISNSFIHPLDDSKKIFVFSDAPHLIKCVRNRILDKSHLQIPEGYISWKYYRILYESDSSMPGNLRVCPKISANHIKPTNFLKMRVKLATQIFSMSVTNGLMFYKEKNVPGFSNVNATITFTKIFNDLFDALNRKYPAEGVRQNSSDLLILQQTLDWLDEWEKNVDQGIIHKDEYLTKNTAHGLRVTITSTIQLCEYLLTQCDFQYVLTAKLNQDALEKFFGIIRQAGCQNDHPTYLTFLQLYKLLSVYKLIKPPIWGNCTISIEDSKENINFDDIKLIWNTKNSSNRQNHVQKLKKRLDGLINMELWEADDIFPNYDANISNCITYYVTGFLCRKLQKNTKCQICRNTLKSNNENHAPIGLLTNIKSRGYLIHPNLNMYNLILEIENYFSKNIETSSDIYEDTIDHIINNYNFTFPCEDHMYDMLAYILHYYILLRMRQYYKQEDMKCVKNSREKKKLAKVMNT